MALGWLVPPASTAAPEAAPPEAARNASAARRDARMRWWREARFGMFIHWGLYAIPAGKWKGEEIG
ncbi:MAG: alpha-L-fucosidase, partial [Planctomycetes bacterium]|nr:alpha-L-fucosidase [Planctomycetota bacterium]